VDIEAGGRGLKGKKDADGTIHSCFASIVREHSSPEDREALANLVRFVDAQDAHGSAVKFLAPDLDKEAQAVLERYRWPGNVRELKNMVERLCVLSVSGTITADDIPEEIRAGKVAISGNLKRMVDEYEKNLIVQALEDSGGNQNAAASQLGVSRQNLYYKMKV